MLTQIAAAFGVGLFLALFGYVKGRTAWHWFLLSFVAYGIVWVATVVAVSVAGIQIWYGSPKLALFVAALTAFPLLITVISVPTRPRFAASRSRTATLASREPGA